jgi:site-specific DNA-methyltransferase (cytosine-N4-specific)
MISYDFELGDSYEVLDKFTRDPRRKGRYRLIITSPPYFHHRHYGDDPREIGQEETDAIFIDKLTNIFMKCRNLLTEDGSLWIVLGDTRRKYGKLMIPHRLALNLVKKVGYIFREDIIWFKKNNISSSSKDNFAQAYEVVLFLSRKEKCYANMDGIRKLGNEAEEGRNRVPPSRLIQYEPIKPDREKILKIKKIIHNAKPDTPFDELPTTTEIAQAYGFDPEKFCPTCYRKFKRHATRKRIGDHSHYPIFAVCNPNGKNPGNVWEISTKAHYGNEHFAIFPEDLVERIINFGSERGDWILDPFVGSGTTGIACAKLKRNFTGIDLYPENLDTANKYIESAIKGKFRLKTQYQTERSRREYSTTLESFIVGHRDKLTV